MENNLRFVFAPIGIVLFFAFLLAGLFFAGVSLAVGAFGFVRAQLTVTARMVLFS